MATRFGQRASRAAVCAALLLLPLFPSARARTQDGPRFAHGYEDAEPWYLPTGTTREEADALQSRWDALAAEIRSGAARAPAGTYERYGAMRSGFLRWSPAGGYVYLYVYENFVAIRFGYGRVNVEPSGRVVFEAEGGRVQPGSEGFGPFGRRWVPAGWKGAAYLVPEREMSGFGQYVAGLGQFNDFNGPCCEFAPFYTRREEDGAGAGVDAPAVPRRYAGLMRRPFEATLTRVGRARRVREYGLEGEFYSSLLSDVTLTPVRLSAGRAPGMRPGLLFRFADGRDGQYLKVTRVGRRASAGVVIRRLDEKGAEQCIAPRGVGYVRCQPLAAGARVTTSPR